MRAALVLAALVVAGCDTTIYEQAGKGELDGSLVVMWVGEGAPAAGDGKFVFVPLRNDPLTFARPGGQVIRPGMIYTDGGSIPRIAQPLKGFSPWGYAPAYMIHDWLFVAQKCANAGAATPDEAKAVADLAFRDSAVILAEVIKTLIDTGRVGRNDVAPGAITWAVSSPVSQRLWEDSACPQPRISAAHAAQVENAFAAAAGLRIKTNAPVARIVAQIGF